MANNSGVKRNLNSKTTTLKIPTWGNGAQDAILRHDALLAILVSANPLRAEYDLKDEDYDHIVEVREKVFHEVAQIEEFLRTRRR